MELTIGCVVSGHGETQAVPILLRRIGAHFRPEASLRIHSVRITETKLIRPGEMERAVELVARRVGLNGRIFVILDADDACPAQLGPELLKRVSETRPDARVAVVLAKREFEAWFLSSAESIQGKRGLPQVLQAPVNPEEIRGAKEWLGRQMRLGGQARAYAETVDQAALTAVFDLELARSRSDSFAKCFREIEALLAP